MSYHLDKIDKGVYGERSKIVEEFQEWQDSYKQSNPIMELVELSDLIGAIEAYISKYNLTLKDLIVMKDVTNKAFISRYRK